MAPVADSLTFDSSTAFSQFKEQWTHPGDVFTALLILGGDTVGRVLAQVAGRGTPPPPDATYFYQTSTPLNVSSQFATSRAKNAHEAPSQHDAWDWGQPRRSAVVTSQYNIGEATPRRVIGCRPHEGEKRKLRNQPC